MQQQQELRKITLNWSTAFAAALVLFILFGLGTKLILSLNMSLNSDSVGEGLLAMEIWKHQNYFLSGYYLPSQDTFLFTELIPFQLIPQILTNYDPTALKVVTYIEFALGAGILSYVVYLLVGDLNSALLFAALTTNVSPEAYQFFWFPTSHGGTVIFLGLIFALLLYMSKTEGERAHKTKKKKKVLSAKIQWSYIAGLVLLVALTVVSDTIILPWLIVPYMLIYVLFEKEKSNTMNIAVASMAVVSAIMYIFKTYFVYTWVVRDIFAPRATTDILSMATLYVNSFSILLNTGLYSVVRGFKDFGIPEAASLLLFAALVAYAVKNAVKDRERWIYYGIFLASGITMLGMWLISNYTVDMSSTRYLIFTALTVFMLVAMALRQNDKAFYALVIVFLALSAFFTLTQMGEFQNPNADEYGLISYLKENNQTFGYSTYWRANLITYLSGEEVTVRQALVYRDGLKPGMWLSCERWYQSTPDDTFLLADESALTENARTVIQALAENLDVSEPLHYDQYIIYPIRGYHIAPFQVMR